MSTKEDEDNSNGHGVHICEFCKHIFKWNIWKGYQNISINKNGDSMIKCPKCGTFEDGTK